MALKIRTRDEVIVISGKDRGKTGTVLRVDPTKQRVYVEGLNIIKRHQRPHAARHPAPADRRAASSRARARSTSPTSCCSTPRTASRRASASSREDGERVRVARRSGTEID